MSSAYEIAKILKSLDVYDISPVFETNMPGFITVSSPGHSTRREERRPELLFHADPRDQRAQRLPCRCTHSYPQGLGQHRQVPLRPLDRAVQEVRPHRLQSRGGKEYHPGTDKRGGKRDSLSPEPGDIILLQFGWDKYYLPDSKALFEKDWYAANVPGITEEAMKYFADSRIKAIGSDAASTDAAYTESKIGSMPGREKYFLPNNILPMSGFVNMGGAPAVGLFMAIPLKIRNGSGSPIRPILVDTKKRPDILQSLAALKPHDIGTVFETNMPGFFSHPTLGIVPDARTYEKHGHYMQTLIICEHNGSHTDSFKHIHENMASMEQIPCDFLIGPYKKYDFTKHNPRRLTNITLDEVKEVEARDDIKPEGGDIILLQFGWDKYYRPESNDVEDRMMYSSGPGITEEAVKYFAGAKIQAIGADVTAADCCFPNIPGHLEHFLPNGILIMESFINMGPAPATGLFVGLPWKIKNGSGSPMNPILYG